MSINNLTAQLSWLLSSKPFIPPLPIPRRVSGPESPSRLLEPSESFPRDSFQPENVPGTTNSLADHFEDLEDFDIEDPDTTIMPRLVAGPSPTRRPRLLDPGHNDVGTLSEHANTPLQRDQRSRQEWTQCEI